MNVSITKVSDSVTPSIRNLIKAIDTQGRNQLLLRMGQEFLRQTLSNFKGNNEYTDKSWAPLSKNYAKKVGSSKATDYRTGQLKNSIQLGRPRDSYIEVFTRNKYAAAIAFGDKSKNLPPRNFFPVQNIGGPSYSKLVYRSEQDLFRVLSVSLTTLSSGAFPNQSNAFGRQTPTYGNPFTAPQKSAEI